MIQMHMTLELGDLLAIKGAITKEVFPLVHQAVRAVAFQTSANWQQAVLQQGGLWSGEKDRYAQSITWKMTGDFTAVVEASYGGAVGIENGRPGRDLKKMLNTSDKVRRTEKGKRFLIIPFRHQTPGNNAHAPAMPESVYAMAKALNASRVTGQGQRPSGQMVHLNPKSGMSASALHSPFLSDAKTKGHAMVNQNQYQWGGRLKTKGMEGLTPQQRRNLNGMVRFDTGTAQTPHSTYLTFRVMIEGSKGWVTKPEPGRFIAKGVTDKMQPLALAAMTEAIKRTLG